MARPVTVTVEGELPLRAGATYPGVVCGIEKKSKPQHLQVKLRNLDPKQEGRVHEITLLLPVRPSGKTAAFFRAVGEKVEIGRAIPVRSAVGKVVKMKFGSSPEGSVDVVSFEPPAKEIKNDTEPE